MKKHFLSKLLLVLPLLASAYDCKVDGIYYILNITSKTAEVTFKDDNYNSYYGYINIPEKFSFDGVDYSVSGIGEYAFYLCDNLKSVNIPNSVTNIGDYGFNLCKSLKNVTIPKSVKSIGNSAFGGCISLQYVNITDLAAWCNIEFKDPNSNPTYQAYPNPIYLDGEEIKELVIPNGVTTIRKYAFNKCDGLTSVTIPNSVTTIEGWTFEGCI